MGTKKQGDRIVQNRGFIEMGAAKKAARFDLEGCFLIKFLPVDDW